MTEEDKESTSERHVFDEDNPENILSGTIRGDGSLVLKVYFREEFTVTYDPNGGNFDGDTWPASFIYGYGEEITIIDAPDRNGYIFEYWKGSEYQPGDSYTVTGDKLFTAQWRKDDASKPDEPKKEELAPSRTKNPKTGDPNDHTLWIALLGAAALVIIITVLFGGKKKQ